MKEYNLLYKKFQKGTITKEQKKRLFDLAFGSEFMENKDPNKKWRV
tara:strand:- start:415 stop:552 length:138 start_codon:yes stop_codon:yes gene_type:complete